MTRQEVSFVNSRGQNLAGIVRFSEPVEPKEYPVVIVLHGFNEHKHHDLTADIANNLVHYGFLTLRFDFHGHGESDGKFEAHTIHQQVDDVFAALDFVSELPYADANRVCVVGTDIGGNIALLAAEKDARIKALVVQGARSHFENHINSWFQPSHIDEMFAKGVYEHHNFRLRKEYVNSTRQHDVMESLKNMHAPLLILHANNDLRVKIQEARQIFLAANEPKQLQEIEGADHWFRKHREEFVEMAGQWFRRWVR